MTTAYTTLLGLALPVQGELTGTWGQTVNTSITQLLDDAVAGTSSYDVSGGNWTLTNPDGGTGTARSAILRLYGTAGASINVIAPSQSKAYVIENQSNVVVVVKGSATSGVSIAAGKTTVVAWNNADFIEIVPSVATSANGLNSSTTTVSVSGATAPTSGYVLTATSSSTATWQPVSSAATTATNLAGGSVGTIPYQSGASTTAMLSAGTSGQVLLSGGEAAPTWGSPLPTQAGHAGEFLTTSGTAASWTTAPGAVADTQTFTSSGTWTKPTGAQWVQVIMWGAGASGGSTSTNGVGGGGGAYIAVIFPASSLSSTVSVTIGPGGASITNTSSTGNNGSNSTFGAYLTAYGGKADGTGGAGTLANGINTGGNLLPFGNAYADAGGSIPRFSSGTYAPDFSGGNSVMGGAGGGAVGNYNSSAFSVGGTSMYGGNGGTASYSGAGTAGSVPGGGGGGSLGNASGAGGAGKCIVYSW